MKKIIVIFFVGITIFSFSCCLNCKRVVGKGSIVAETRTTGAFTQIESNISGDVIITQNATASILVKAQKNILQYVKDTIENGVLKIYIADGVNLIHDDDIKVLVAAPTIESLSLAGSGEIEAKNGLSGDSLELSLAGSGDIDVDNLQYNSIKSDLAGSGDIDLSGTVKNLTIHLSGSGDVDTKKLNAKNVKVVVSGSGDADVNAADTLDAIISGSGDIEYSGNATTVNQTVSGSGSIHKR